MSAVIQSLEVNGKGHFFRKLKLKFFKRKQKFSQMEQVCCLKLRRNDRRGERLSWWKQNGKCLFLLVELKKNRSITFHLIKNRQIGKNQRQCYKAFNLQKHRSSKTLLFCHVPTSMNFHLASFRKFLHDIHSRKF